MRVLFTGSSGLLGKHLVPLIKDMDGDGNMFEKIEVDTPTHKEMDITKELPDKKYGLVVHAAAYTDVVRAEKEQGKCFAVNVAGTLNLIQAYPETPFVFISSEYANNPVNYYSQTKKEAENQIILHSKKYLIIRTLFKPNPFPWDNAFIDQYTQGDYVDVIAKLIRNEMFKWDKETSKIIYIGTGRKTIYELASKTRKVKMSHVGDVKEVVLPKDYL